MAGLGGQSERSIGLASDTRGDSQAHLSTNNEYQVSDHPTMSIKVA